MKRYLSIILSLALLLSVSVSAATLDDESPLSIPSPSEIETYYRQAIIIFCTEFRNICTVLAVAG